MFWLKTVLLHMFLQLKFDRKVIRCVLYLTRYPEVQAAAREEVEQVDFPLDFEVWEGFHYT